MYQRILVPLDGSPVAEQVLPLLKMLVVRFQSSLILFQAIEPISQRATVEGAALHPDDHAEQLRKQALEYLEAIKPRFPSGITVQHEIRTGLPARAILEFAESTRIDLIAMATHGRTGLQRWVYGSVADKVLSGARLPILLVRASVAHSIASIKRDSGSFGWLNPGGTSSDARPDSRPSLRRGGGVVAHGGALPLCSGRTRGRDVRRIRRCAA